MKIAPYSSGMLTCITQSGVLGFLALANGSFVMQLHHVLFLDHNYCFQLVQVITNFPLSGQVVVMCF